MSNHQRVVIVGGGVSGLATAYLLARDGGPDVEVVLVEAADRLGGKILTQDVAGHPVDMGPDALLVRLPAMRSLLEDLGLTAAIVAPGASGAFIWSRARLRPLPPSTLFGIPQKLLPLLRSGLLSPLGVLRAALDLVLPRTRTGDDPSVGELVRPRFGAEVFERLVDPMLGGVHAGRADELSAQSSVPEIAALARRSRSIYLGSRSMRRGSTSSGPALVTLDGGLTRLVDTLVSQLDRCDVRLGARVTGLRRADGGRDTAASDGHGYVVTLAGGEELAADAVVLATPAFVTADLLARVAPDASVAAREVPYADVASLTLVYPRSAVTHPLDGTGFLVPPEEGLLLVGCSWLPAKWPNLADPSHVLIRAMVGRHGDDRFATMDDDALVAQVHRELALTMGMSAPPASASVQRWPRAMPQYTVGHRRRLERIDHALTDAPGIHVTGAAFGGVGIASCVARAQRTAATLAAESRYSTDSTDGTASTSRTHTTDTTGTVDAAAVAPSRGRA
ncbi:protoporphyrinogen oxidase [Cellulomonas sp. P24]|uniref:protoporphyrinogen oxidase n=1 Tax=Cellulomonas sp. P24 TaxID=2885206 RepID=UPI00216ACFD9|nr:protoporphyrinogen oxidase [Cellulomonas sp. P24]MCR6493210.1 protoporphyrinogen oxidase [Cellulomonas sp. P24]